MKSDNKPIKPEILPPINTHYQVLPFEQLHWETFEDLCLRLVEIEFSIHECEKRGTPGQNQDGIDIFARRKDGFYNVYQCKRHNNFSTTDLDNVINKFRKSDYYKKCRKFYICTSYELNSTQIQDAFLEHKSALERNNIELIKWDKKKLSSILKNYPDIVYDFFSIEWVKRFNGEESLTKIFKITEKEILQQFGFASGELISINNQFSNLKGSHIIRKETKELQDWIFKDFEEEESRIAILEGNAGIGKTVILKDLLDLLTKQNIPTLGLKSDKKTIDLFNLGSSILGLHENFYKIFEQITAKHKVVVLLIDQIDALSRSLSTNREQISAYFSMVYTLSQFKKIRIIVSCRTFDLNHDPDLKQFLNKKIIKASLLSEQEVLSVIKLLTKDKNFTLPKDLKELLKIPLHLEIFCRIYYKSMPLNEIKNLQDLYRNLWNLKILYPNGADISPQNLINILFQLADEIYKRQENLSVPSILFDKYSKEISYLNSESLITENYNTTQFFHQSFFDYVFARYFVEKDGGNIFRFLIHTKHQGLFLRSITKQVLTFLRLYNPDLYIKQVNEIIGSDKIRYHLKLLIVEQLSFEEAPTIAEYKLVISLHQQYRNLFISFFQTVSGEKWFSNISKDRNLLNSCLNSEDKVLEESIGRFIVFSAKKNIEEAISILNGIKASKIKASYLLWLLYRGGDFSLPAVTKTYFELEKEHLDNNEKRFHILSNAIESNPEFAISESQKLFESIIKDWKRLRRRELGYNSDESKLVDFCEKLYEKQSEKAYPFFKEIVTTLIEKTKFDSPYKEYNFLKEDYAFQDYQPDVYEFHKLLDWLVKFLVREDNKQSNFSQDEILGFLSSKSATLYFIAFQVILASPNKYLAVIVPTLVKKEIVSDIFWIENLKYYYRELIHKTYVLFSSEQKQQFKEFVIKYYTKSDFARDPTWRDRGKTVGKLSPHYPYLGHDQWLILKSIPLENLKKDGLLRTRLYMLNRKFVGWHPENKKPNHSVVAASVLGGLMSIENYQKYTDRHWLSTFYKFERKDFRYSIDHNFSIEEHAKSFKEVIKRNPQKYVLLVTKIIEENTVHFRYQIHGIEGLIEGNFDVKKVRKFYSIIMKRKIPDEYLSTFIDLSIYFIQNSLIDSEIINYWKKHVELPFNTSKDRYLHNADEDKKTILFDQGWITPNARAIKLLIRLADNKKYTDKVYRYFLDIASTIPIQIRLVVLYWINNGCRFDNEQIITLFQSYTREVTTEVYQIGSRVINAVFHYNFKRVISFVNDTITLPEAAEHLGVYLLYGWFYGNESSKELLLKLHEQQPKSIGESIQQACRYLNEKEFQKKCLFILNRYADDKRKMVREGFSHGFHYLHPNDLPLLTDIIAKYITELNEERLYSLYHYLISCTKDYPRECVKIVGMIDFDKISENRFEIEEPIKILMLSYNSIRKYDTSESSAEYVMDVFDTTLHQLKSKSEVDKIFRELDFE